MKAMLSVILVSLLTPGCAHFLIKEKTYESGEAVTINGAEVRSAVKPMGGSQGMAVSAMVYNAAMGSTDGPFLWRIEARGREGIHESLTVHHVRVKTSLSQRDEPYPAKYLGEKKPFLPMKGKEGAGRVFASYQLPGKLEVYPETDGLITIEADISVSASGRSERRTARFTMSPKSQRENQMIFLPAELIGSLGRPDPTEWQWSSQPTGSSFDDDNWWLY
ncbi:MAG: hypothetical protein Q7Q71_00425 [Verrucomicrobiota bacterium JB023]|nr:hypothetical protein [Verrucomicrobiota bacterium JB023]